LEIDVKVDDLKAYTKPWTIRLNQSLAVDTDLRQFFCVAYDGLGPGFMKSGDDPDAKPSDKLARGTHLNE